MRVGGGGDAVHTPQKVLTTESYQWYLKHLPMYIS